MTAPAPPPVDPELAEAELGMRSIVSHPTHPLVKTGAIAAIKDDVRRIMAEYDRRGEIMDLLDTTLDQVRAQLLDVLEHSAFVPNAELSRLRRIESAASALIDSRVCTTGPVTSTGYERAIVGVSEFADLAAALAAEVEKP